MTEVDIRVREGEGREECLQSGGRERDALKTAYAKASCVLE